MTTIGTFSKADDGSFHGAMRTLTLSADPVRLQPIARTGDKAPDYRVFAGDLEVGAAWTVTQAGKPQCLSVRIDDPSLPAPLCALLADSGEGFELRWLRRRPG